jgi:hypothetical protein
MITPGPWNTYEMHVHELLVRHMVAPRMGGAVAGIALSGNSLMDAANARLIAAAPQLLEAAQAALAVMVDTELDEYFDQGRIDQALTLLRQAIAAAGVQS